MNADDFRRIALGLEGTIEGAHMGHPDFRAGGRIFASIHPDPRVAMVKLSPEQQEQFVTDHPRAFAPEAGAWGRQGYTKVQLHAVDEDTVGEAMTLAWRNVNTRGSRGAKGSRSSRGA